MNQTQTEVLNVIRSAVQARKAYSTADSPTVPDDITERLRTAAALAHALYCDLRAGNVSISLPSYSNVTAGPDDIAFWSFHAIEDFANAVA